MIDDQEPDARSRKRSALTRMLPLRWKRAIGDGLDLIASEHGLSRARMARARRLSAQSQKLIVAGFFGRSSGVGRSARIVLDRLIEDGRQVSSYDMGALFDPYTWRPECPASFNNAGSLMLVCNAPEARAFFGRTGHQWWGGMRRFGYWAWELPKVPRSWLRTSRFFDEIWVPSPFVQEALEGAHCPVRCVPFPIPLTFTQCPADRTRFNLPSASTIFLTMADAASSFTRKNPLGALKAYELAFPRASASTMLVVKLQSSHKPDRLGPFRDAAARRPDIRILADHLSDDDMACLVAACDVIVSLHRSEGFGLPLAEAMASGRAVLATGWSGNMGFMSGLDEALVGYRLVPTSDPDGIYAEQGQCWAEPDLQDAAARMRAFAADSDLRERVAHAGRRHILALDATWRAATKRLTTAPFA